MTEVDWYRNIEWNDEIEAHFYAKLNRSRSQKYQYLVIQALILAERFPEVSLRLVKEYFETRVDNFEDVRALLAKANAYLALTNFKESVNTYKTILVSEKVTPNIQTSAYLDYPFLVATQKMTLEFPEAQDVLNEHFSRLTFPLDYFKWHASKALINNDADEAIKALDAAKIKRSGFRFHQDVGLVGEEYKKTIKQLCNISKL